MLDQQTSQNIAKRGIGLADMLVRQLSQSTQQQALAIGNDGTASAVPTRCQWQHWRAGQPDGCAPARAIAAAGGPARVQ
jgi:flagellar protein FlgJ